MVLPLVVGTAHRYAPLWIVPALRHPLLPLLIALARLLCQPLPLALVPIGMDLWLVAVAPRLKWSQLLLLSLQAPLLGKGVGEVTARLLLRLGCAPAACLALLWGVPPVHRGLLGDRKGVLRAGGVLASGVCRGQARGFLALPPLEGPKACQLDQVPWVHPRPHRQQGWSQGLLAVCRGGEGWV